MQAQFSIINEPAMGLMRIIVSGFFEPADVARFGAARVAALRALGTAPNQHLTLVDIREIDIQPQDSVIAFGDLLSDPLTISRRIAFIVPRSLASMQVRRAAASSPAAFFLDPGPAEAWLFAASPALRATG